MDMSWCMTGTCVLQVTRASHKLAVCQLSPRCGQKNSNSADYVLFGLTVISSKNRLLKADDKHSPSLLLQEVVFSIQDGYRELHVLGTQ
ncbi:hypothetical protein F4678DRAFT_422764 [Xylaria arbuscula]|nr:hypothetical protein F4678DRAFT_422764 [Xylaria arbuscula]